MRGLAMFLAALFLWSAGAQATVMFEVVRLDDSRARISGTGTFDRTTTDWIALGNATSIGPFEFASFQGRMSAGDAGLIFTANQEAAPEFILGFNQNIMAGSSPMGAVKVELADVFWEPVRTQGDVFDQRSGAQLGRYEIVAPVPVPATGILLVGGLVALASWGRQHRSGR